MKLPVIVGFLLGLLSLSPAPAHTQDKDKPNTWPTRLRGNYYTVLSTCSRSQAARLTKHMDIVFASYVRVLALQKRAIKNIKKDKLTLILYKNLEEYKTKEKREGSVAHYDGNHLVGYFHEDKMENYFAHEGFHQFAHRALQAVYKAPSWFNEGMAECIGNSVVKNKKLYMCAINGRIAQENLPIAKRTIREGKHDSLKDLLTMDKETFKSKRNMYSLVWSLCHFLMAYPKYHEPNRQIPNGKYRYILTKYLQSIANDKLDNPQAIEAAFTERKSRKRLDLDKLEKEWKEYILAWPFYKGDGKALKAYEKLEKKLAKAKTLQLDFEISAEGAGGISQKGSLIVDRDKYRLKMTGKYYGAPYQLDLVSDGDTIRLVKATHARKWLPRKTPKDFGRIWFNTLLQGSFYATEFLKEVDRLDMKKWNLSSLFQFGYMKLGARKKINGAMAQSIHGTFLAYEARKYDSTLWLDARTSLPIRRSYQVSYKEGTATVTETYQNIRIDEKVDPNVFK